MPSRSSDPMQMTWRLRGNPCTPSTREIGAALAVALTIVLVTGQVTALQDRARPLDPGSIALIMVATLALAWRRCSPVIALAVVVALVASYLLMGYPYGPIQLCMVIAMFEVARLRGLRTSLLACVAAVAITATAILFRALVRADAPALLLALWSSWLVVPWSLGALVRVRTAAAQRARQDLAARVALEERLRVAREVHDVAGHGLAAVAMQAGVALLVLDEQPEQVKKSLEAIQSTSVKALADLRTTLDAFHSRARADADNQAASGADGLRNVAALVDNVRAAGLPVRLSLEDVTAPAAIDRIAYRVVQEALTNVLRHAGPTTAEVRVHRELDWLVVEVLDRGVGADLVQSGLGLTGMRNRVTAVGGELTVQTRVDEGFRVCARLPLAGDVT
jgi:signal transduction histidine kinase